MIPLPQDSKVREAIIDKYFETEGWESDYNASSGEIKAIGDYSGLSFNEVLNLPISLFLLLKKDAWMYNNMQSEKGKEFLKALWRLKQTEPDYEAIRNFQKRGDS
ncbi:MAG: hypothetical protein HFE82_06805 [Erysipelotrichaceae bacterium]|nr:hypothetical protein [Erysipelotrichaceae bacterium]